MFARVPRVLWMNRSRCPSPPLTVSLFLVLALSCKVDATMPRGLLAFSFLSTFEVVVRSNLHHNEPHRSPRVCGPSVQLQPLSGEPFFRRGRLLLASPNALCAEFL